MKATTNGNEMASSSVRQLLNAAGPSDATSLAATQVANVLSTMPSTSTSSSAQPKRFKLDAKFDVDDTCSNDAFAFNRQTHNDQQQINALSQQQPQLKNPKLTATPVTYNGLK